MDLLTPLPAHGPNSVLGTQPGQITPMTACLACIPDCALQRSSLLAEAHSAHRDAGPCCITLPCERTAWKLWLAQELPSDGDDIAALLSVVEVRAHLCREPLFPGSGRLEPLHAASSHQKRSRNLLSAVWRGCSGAVAPSARMRRGLQSSAPCTGCPPIVRPTSCTRAARD